MKEKIMEIWGIILDILFPPVCLVCRKKLLSNEPQPNLPSKTRIILLQRQNFLFPRPDGFRFAKDQARRGCEIFSQTSLVGVCSLCSQKIKINNTAFCPVCSRRLPENKKTCHQESPFILAAAGFYGDEVLDPLIALLKYQKIKQAAVPLGEILSQYLNNLIAGGLEIEDFLIIPVPLHWRKEKQRGFNQANLIADCLSKNTGLPVVKNILKRIKNTASQVELKDKDKREINILGCFEVAKPELVFDKNILLLDDVFTTGATIKEAASVIKKSGARKIIGLVVAKT